MSLVMSIRPHESSVEDVIEFTNLLCQLAKVDMPNFYDDMVHTIVDGRFVIVRPSSLPENRRKVRDDIGLADIKGFTAVDGKVVWSNEKTGG